jgi:hypothetical protein
MGFIYDYDEFIWDHRYTLLADYRDEYPNQWPKKGEPYQENALGDWCLEQAKSAKKLSADKLAKLKVLNFPFDFYNNQPEPEVVRKSDKEIWNETFEQYAAFCGKNGRAPMLNDPIYYGSRLNRWINKQKRLDRSGLLSPERSASIQALLKTYNLID